MNRVEDLAERAKLGLWVKDAALVEHPRGNRTKYYVSDDRQRSGSGAALGKLQSWIARIGPSRLVQVPEGTPVSEVHAELSRRDFGQPLDHIKYSIQAITEPISPQLSLTRRALGAASLLASMICIAAVVWASGPWRLLPVAAAIAAAVSFVLSVRPKSVWGWVTCAAIWTASAGIAAIAAVRFGDSPLRLFGGLCLASFGIFIASGVVFAIRGSWLARNVVWAVPLSITLLAPVVPWLGGVVFAEYLSQLDIPDSAVSVSTVWKVIAGTGPILFGMAVVLILFGLIGWLRYFHVVDRYTRSGISFMAAVVVLVYALTSVQLGLASADNAAAHAKTAAQNGRNPASYFGLQGTLVCLEPLHTPVPVLYGPLPTGQPVLLFTPSGERLWAWDPGSIDAHSHGSHGLSVPLQDVAVIQATGQPAACPPNAR
jgi:hypothetical protein